jgi:hypothetical protein
MQMREIAVAALQLALLLALSALAYWALTPMLVTTAVIALITAQVASAIRVRSVAVTQAAAARTIAGATMFAAAVSIAAGAKKSAINAASA